MRKNDLIEILQRVPGNPEVVLWNGYVGDYMHIAGVVESDLVKMTESHYLETCRLEACVDQRIWDFQFSQDELDRLKKSYRKVCNWETGEFVTQRDIDSERYKRKRVLYINAKLRGETHHDRLGAVSY